MAERAFYLNAYSSAPIKVNRLTRSTLFIERPVLSLLGFIQPGPYAQIVREAQRVDSKGADGLLQRFMTVLVRERAWQEERPEIPEEAKEAYHALIFRLYDLLHSGDELVLGFTEEAQEIWYEWENETERAKRAPEISDAWRGLLSKRKGLTARLALLLSLVWEEEGEISKDSLFRAILTVKLVEEHTKKVWGEAVGGRSPALFKLAEKLKRGELTAFTLRHLYTNSVAGITSASEARRVVGELVEAGWVLPDPENPQRFLVNPKCRVALAQVTPEGRTLRAKHQEDREEGQEEG